ncbi:MAG: type II secretion system protein GspG [SAR324 cluster bacterium]|nr:type II secretion system protein GspG [SAR324 cluster bacterium]
MTQEILLLVLLFIIFISIPYTSAEGRDTPQKSTTRSSQLLQAQERQQTLQRMRQLKQSLLNYYWDIRTFPTTLQGVLQNSDAETDWNGSYGDEELLTDVWGNSICYESLGTASVPNPYNKDGSPALIPKVRLWANDPDNRCSNGQPPGTEALVVNVQPSISRFNQQARARLNIAVRVFNQSGQILADLNTVPAQQAIEVIPSLSEYYQEYGKEKFWWYSTDRLFYSSGLNRIPEDGSGDDIIPSVTIGKGPCNTMITSDMTTNTIWVPANSPYCIGASVAATENFEIEPGVEVLFLGNYNLTIEKNPKIWGTSAAPITFSSFVNNPAPNKYEGGYINMIKSSTLKWIIVENGRGLAHVDNNGALKVYDSIFRKNGADAGSGDHSNGGAIRVLGNGGLQVYRGTFQNNKADNYGGAIWRKGNGNVHLEDTTSITNNSAAYGGGVYVQGNGNLKLRGCSSVTNNTAGTQGGGVWYADISSFDIDSADIAGNTPDNVYSPSTGSDTSETSCGS